MLMPMNIFPMPGLYCGAPDDVIDKRGLGLLGMKERVTLLGGVVRLCSSPGQGTQIDIRIPIMEAEVECA
jgi:signal transduction histidine kinase